MVEQRRPASPVSPYNPTSPLEMEALLCIVAMAGDWHSPAPDRPLAATSEPHRAGTIRLICTTRLGGAPQSPFEKGRVTQYT